MVVSEHRGQDMGTARVIDLAVTDLGSGLHKLQMKTVSPEGAKFVVEVEGPAELVDADAKYLGEQYGVTPRGDLVLA